ncbi:unnamed protein product [Arctia plantaginis]|uniref:Uncharacterized protein n=1 Tax=Arctia plantaginis TaxID=874455 RepID=A0A8S1B380_ARCPL|nr:unnamed protein product [Arctia plantaginis]
MDIRVRRDVQEAERLTYMRHISTGSIQSDNNDGVREKREIYDKKSSKANITRNNDWRNTYVWSKIKSYRNERNNTSRNIKPQSGYKNGTRRYKMQHTIMPRYNMTGFKSGTLYPGSHYNSTAYNRHILQNIKTNTGNNTGSTFTNAFVPGNGTSTPGRDIIPATPGHRNKSGVNGTKTRVNACVLCKIPCPVGRHRDESGLYCIADDMEY